MAAYLIERLSIRYKVSGKSLSSEGTRRLLAHEWPGNVRELAHELERSLIFEENDSLDLVMLAGAGKTDVPGGMTSDLWFNPAFQFPEDGFDIEEAVLDIINHALRQTNQNVSAAARLLGVNRDYIRYRLSGKKS